MFITQEWKTVESWNVKWVKIQNKKRRSKIELFRNICNLFLNMETWDKISWSACIEDVSALKILNNLSNLKDQPIFRPEATSTDYFVRPSVRLLPEKI